MIKRDSKGRFIKGNKLPENWGGVIKGEKSPFWKGNNVGYDGLHTWVRKTLGKPIKCSLCGVENKRIEWANISGEYKRDINDWKQLCCKCHSKIDGVSERQRGKNNSIFRVKNITPAKIKFGLNYHHYQFINIHN